MGLCQRHLGSAARQRTLRSPSSGLALPPPGPPLPTLPLAAGPQPPGSCSALISPPAPHQGSLHRPLFLQMGCSWTTDEHTDNNLCHPGLSEEPEGDVKTSFQNHLRHPCCLSRSREGVPEKPSNCPPPPRSWGIPAPPALPPPGTGAAPPPQPSPPSQVLGAAPPPRPMVALIQRGCLEEAARGAALATLPRSPPSGWRFPWTDVPEPLLSARPRLFGDPVVLQQGRGGTDENEENRQGGENRGVGSQGADRGSGWEGHAPSGAGRVTPVWPEQESQG